MSGGGGKTGTTTQTTQIPAEVLARYNSVNDTAAATATTPFHSYGTDPNNFVAPINAQQNTGIAGINAGANVAQPAFESAISGTKGLAAAADPSKFGAGVSNYMNPYMNGAVSATVGQMNNINQQQQNQMQGDYISKGAFGGDRANIGLGALMNQQNLAEGQTIAGMENTGFQNAANNYFTGLNTSLGAQQQVAGLGAAEQNAELQGAQAQVGAGTLQQQTEQAGKSALYNQFQQANAYPFQTAQFLANIAEGTGALSGNTTTSTHPVSFFGGLKAGGRVGRSYGGGLDPEGYAAGGSADDYVSAVMKQLFGGSSPDSGEYGTGAGAPGVAGYIPKANIPIRYLPQQYQNGYYPRGTNPFSSMDSTLRSGEDLYNSGKAAASSIDNIINPGLYGRKFGGATRGSFADGGMPYSSGYVPLPDSSTPDHLMMQPATLPKSDSGGGLGDLIKIGGDIAKIAMMKRGGAARRGFALDGAVDDSANIDPSGNSPSPDPSSDSGGFEDWLQKKAYGLGLVDNPDAGAVRKAAYGDTPPNTNWPWPNKDVPPTPNALPTPPSDAASWFSPSNSILKSLFEKPAAPMQNSDEMAAAGNFNPSVGLGRAAAQPSVPEAPTYLDKAEGAPGLAAALPASVSASAAPVAPTQPAMPSAGLGAAAATTPPPKVANLPIAPDQGAAAAAMFRQRALQTEGFTINPNDPNGGTRAGFNLSQYQNVNPNVKSLNDIRPQDVQAAQNSWFSSVGADQLAQKYGPHFAAAYADISMLNPNKASAALSEAGGDPNKFFAIMGSKLAATPDPQGAKGAWLKRVADDQALALGNGSPNSTNVAVPQMAADQVAPRSGLGAGANAVSFPPNQPSSGASPGGLGGLEAMLQGDMKGGNPGLLLPLLEGIGAMASSPSRYLGSAILQGVGAGAGAYADRQKQMSGINQTNADTLNRLATVVPNSVYQDPYSKVSWIPIKGGGWMPLPQFAMSKGVQSVFGDAVDARMRSTGLAPEGATAGAEAPTAEGSNGPQFSPAEQGIIDSTNRANKGNPMMIGDAMNQLRTDMAQKVNPAASAAVQDNPNIREQNSLVATGISKGQMGSYQSWMTDNVTKPLQTLANLLGLNYTPDQLLNDPAARAETLRKISTINASNLTPEDQHSIQAFNKFQGISPNVDMTPGAGAAISSLLTVNNQKAIDAQTYYPNFATKTNGSTQGVDQAQQAHYNYPSERKAISDMMLKSQSDPRMAQFFEWAAGGKFRGPDDVKEALNRFGMGKVLKENPYITRYFATAGAT